mgnify:FL=1|jgi:hypothetical protein
MDRWHLRMSRRKLLKLLVYVTEHSVDLIALDMVIPKGINGRKTYKEIIKIRPGQKTIMNSGDSVFIFNLNVRSVVCFLHGKNCGSGGGRHL